LYGDVDALKYVDLDSEGLSHYKNDIKSDNNKRYSSFGPNQSTVDHSQKSRKDKSLSQILYSERDVIRSKNGSSKQSITKFEDKNQNQKMTISNKSNNNPKHSSASKLDAIIKIFSVLDDDNDGLVTADEIKKIILKINKVLKEKHFNQNQLNRILNSDACSNYLFFDINKFKTLLKLVL
jgi:hypothetical protein